MKPSILSSTGLTAAACLALAAPSASAVTIFSATTSNTTAISNFTAPTISGSTPNLIVTNASEANNMGGFASTSDINTLNGTSITVADTVTISMTVDSITGGIFRHNGVEFGMANSVGFRPADSLLLGMKAPNQGSDVHIVSSFQDVGSLDFNSREAELLDGFTITLTANSAGYSFVLSGIYVAGSTNPLYTDGDTTATISGTFAGTEFLDNFGTGYFYTAVQQQTAAQVIVDYSVATIDVVPEPSAVTLLGLCGAGLLLRRRNR